MANQTVAQAVLVDVDTPFDNRMYLQLALFDSEGVQRVIPSEAAAQADVAALTSAALTGGESPTEAEHNALRVDVAAIHTVVNALLGKLRTANVIAAS